MNLGRVVHREHALAGRTRRHAAKVQHTAPTGAQSSCDRSARRAPGAPAVQPHEGQLGGYADRHLQRELILAPQRHNAARGSGRHHWRASQSATRPFRHTAHRPAASPSVSMGEARTTMARFLPAPMVPLVHKRRYRCEGRAKRPRAAAATSAAQRRRATRWSRRSSRPRRPCSPAAAPACPLRHARRRAGAARSAISCRQQHRTLVDGPHAKVDGGNACRVRGNGHLAGRP